MKKLMIATAAAGLLAASSFAAFAAEVTGSVTSIDASAGTIVLSDGKTYQVSAMQGSGDAMSGNASGSSDGSASSTVLASFKMGDKVTITYEDVDGKLMASVVAPAKM